MNLQYANDILTSLAFVPLLFLLFCSSSFCFCFLFQLQTRNSKRGFVRLSVRPLVLHGHRVEKWANKCFRYFLCMFEYWEWVRVWMGVGCPCPPVRNDIVTQRHLSSSSFPSFAYLPFDLLWIQSHWGFTISRVLPVNFFIHPSNRLSVHLSICPFVRPTIHPCVHLSAQPWCSCL